MSEQVEILESEAADAVDLWESSEAEALEDFGGEEAVIEEEPEAVESSDEVVPDEAGKAPEEIEAVDETPVDGGEVAEPALEWDGNPDTLPETLRPTHKTMVQGMNKKFVEVNQKLQEAEALRKEYETKLESIAAPQDAEPEGPPPLPTEEVSAEEWNKAQDARQAWFANDAVRQEREAQSKIKSEQEAVTQAYAEAQSRYESLQQADGFSEDIAMAMTQVAEKSPYWAEQLRTSDEGTKALFQLCKYELDAMELKTNNAKSAAEADATIRAKHAAGKRSVSRPKAATLTASEKYAMSGFDDAEAEALERWNNL